MDILELDQMLNQKDRQKLEELVMEAVRTALAEWNRQVAGLQEALDQASEDDLVAAGFWSRAELQSQLEDSIRDRKHFLELLGALTGAEYDYDDYLVNWSVVDRVRAERRRERGNQPQPETLALPAPSDNNSPAAGRRRGAPQTTRLKVLAGMRQSIESGRYTIEQLKSGEVTLDALAAEFDCSRSPVKAARDEIVLQFESEGTSI